MAASIWCSSYGGMLLLLSTLLPSRCLSSRLGLTIPEQGLGAWQDIVLDVAVVNGADILQILAG